MKIKTNYTTGSGGQIVSRGLYAAVERGDTPLDGGFGAPEIIEVDSPGAEPTRVRIDEVPQDTIAITPDEAAKAAIVMQGLSDGSRRGEIGFRVEYLAD